MNIGNHEVDQIVKVFGKEGHNPFKGESLELLRMTERNMRDTLKLVRSARIQAEIEAREDNYSY